MDSAVTTCEIYISNFKNLFGMYGYFSEDKRDIDRLVNWLKSEIMPQYSTTLIKKNDVLKAGIFRTVYPLDKALNYLESQLIIERKEIERTTWIELKKNHPIFA